MSISESIPTSHDYRVIDPDYDIILIVTPKPTASSDPKPEPKATRFKASSKHLTLTSKYFKGRLNSPWPEGEELKQKGIVELDIPDTDPEAFEVVLNLMHCRTKLVPREVELPLLTQIAVVVDYFDCHEALGLYPESWVNKLRDSVPGMFCADAINWIFIAYVFGEADIFSCVTRLAQAQGLGTFDTRQLPIPKKIIDGINSVRIDTLTKMFKILTDYQERLMGPKVICSFECDSTKLGAIIKTMKSRGLLLRAENASFPGYSVRKILDCILDFPRIEVCGKCSSYGFGSREKYSIIDRSTKAEIESAARSLNGLSIPNVL
ncbi:hypothetical protein BDV27DRAFT_129048 [Aspergillus caelatus]|uniref:BTB domain-containing protein n=1 Tax=Aspergillus caelatus TaxID=61420 RepID=A0A5N7A2E7_9EURO|nr:uncharacterized protein BDV27DRAFT_129048 [Aspergillus caelatus]KAE8364047.1 hypothetical protein BDV27DRAFT_129048 [Aspergillus caelatus]